MFNRHKSIARVGLIVALVATLGTLSSRVVRADDDDTTKPEPSYDFKLPPQDKQAPAPDEEPAVTSVNPSNVYYDSEYPRYSVSGFYQPGYIGLTQNLTAGSSTASNYSISEYAPVQFSVAGKAEFSQRFSVEGSLSEARYTTGQQVASLFTINSSSTNVVSANATGFYCFYLNPSGFKFCPGVGVGDDGFPILKASNVANTQLYLSSFADLTVRGTGKFVFPVGNNSNLYLSGGYDYGLINSSGTITKNSEHSIFGSLGFNTPVSIKTDLLFAANLASNASNFAQNSNTYFDKATLFTLSVGAGYHF